MRWLLVNGSRVRFLSDNWVPEVGPLRYLAFKDLTPAELSYPVSHFVTAEGLWDWNHIGVELPNYLFSRILGCHPPRSGDGEAMVASAYELLGESGGGSPDKLWEAI